MFPKNQLLLLAFILILPSFTTAQDAAQPVNCDPNNRPQICPFIFDPVCGWTGIACLVAPCPEAQRDFSNGCEACSDQQIQWYTPGACPDDGVAGGESSVLEELSNEEECVLEESSLPDDAIKCDIPDGVAILCSLEFQPVCAFPGGTTASNACIACTSGAEYYTEGEC